MQQPSRSLSTRNNASSRLKRHSAGPAPALLETRCLLLPLVRVEDQEQLSPALGRFSRDVVQGEGCCGVCVHQTESLAQPQFDLGLGGCCRVAGKRELIGVPGLGSAGELANQSAGALAGGNGNSLGTEVELGQEGLGGTTWLVRIRSHVRKPVPNGLGGSQGRGWSV